MKPYFETDNFKLYFGDSREIIPALKLNYENFALLADPLYGEKIELKRKKENVDRVEILGGLKLLRKDWPEMPNNEPLDPAQFLKFPQAIIWGGNYIADKLPPSRKWIIWDKLHIPPDNHHDCEMAWTNLKGVSLMYRHLWRVICREGSENIVNGPKLHPYQKPVALLMFCISQFKNKPIIVDPFCGSGSSAIASKKLNHKWIGIEILEHYCEVTATRLEKNSKQLQGEWL